MSVYAAMDLCRWIQNLELSASQQGVAHAIAHRLNEHGEAWPSLATLAADTKLGRSTVKRALASLEDLGIITRTRRRLANGGHGSTVYSFGRQWDLFRSPPARKTGARAPATKRHSPTQDWVAQYEADMSAASAAGHAGPWDPRTVSAFLQKRGAGNHASA